MTLERSTEEVQAEPIYQIYYKYDGWADYSKDLWDSLPIPAEDKRILYKSPPDHAAENEKLRKALELARWALEVVDPDEDPNGYCYVVMEVAGTLGTDIGADAPDSIKAKVQAFKERNESVEILKDALSRIANSEPFCGSQSLRRIADNALQQFR